MNNVFVSAFNHEFDADGVPARHPARAGAAVPPRRPHSTTAAHIVDTHDHPIVAGVWELYAEAVRLFPGVPTMIERDANIPPYAELLAELDVARGIAATATAQAASAREAAE